jgi:predicted nucleic acid-binding protein
VSTLLDTNILTRLAQPHHPQHTRARDAVRKLLEGNRELFVVPQNLYEFWVVATRPAADNGLGMPADEARSELSQIKRLFVLLLDERGIFPEWEQLIAAHEIKGKTAHDARLVAAMRRHSLRSLLTFNAGHFSRFPDIEVITPEKVLQTMK